MGAQQGGDMAAKHASTHEALCLTALIFTLAAVFAGSSGATPVAITITADNYYDLYVNGTLVGSQNNADGRYGWDVPETWVVDIAPGVGLIAVAARDESPASNSGIGLIAKIVVTGGQTYVTDGSWRVSEFGPDGWYGLGYDDSAWSPPLDEGPYNSVPWTNYAAPLDMFASAGSRWLWRGSPPFGSGYGYYNSGGYEFCYFRKQVQVGEAPPSPCAGTVCAEASEGSFVTLTAPAGMVFLSLDFASYGTPTGTCGAYSVSSCHASSSMEVLSNACIGQNTCTVAADNSVFGDPCNGTLKRLYVQGCYGSGPTPTHRTTWGSLKAVYR